MDLLLQSSASDALWGIATVVFYIVLASAWSYIGFYQNNRDRGEEWDHEKALPALLSGALIGSAVVWSGQPLNSEYVIAVSGFLIPFLDKVWTTVRRSYSTATDMYADGESLQSIALEIAQIVDRELDQEDVEQVIEEYERRFGPLDPSRENVQERSEQLQEDYEESGVEGAIDGTQQSGPDDPRADEPVPEVDSEDDRYELTPASKADDNDEVVRDGP